MKGYSSPFIKTKILTTIKANTMIPIDEIPHYLKKKKKKKKKNDETKKTNQK
ncbi:MAG TPA: hypothetical protein VHF08_07340 [Nitrososphaeraceae archaeon]|nr:hypothetical protein [Nitrososphaeraceae archaeon]